jgi:hypothetical protein
VPLCDEDKVKILSANAKRVLHLWWKRVSPLRKDLDQGFCARMEQCKAARSPQVDPPANVVNRRHRDTGEQSSPQQAEQKGPIGADDGVESVGMTDLSNHYTLLAGPPAADPFVHTTMELHDRR